MRSKNLHFSNVMVSAGCKHHDAYISLHRTLLNGYCKKETVYTYKIYTHLLKAFHVKEKCAMLDAYTLLHTSAHLYGNQNGMHFAIRGRRHRDDSYCRSSYSSGPSLYLIPAAAGVMNCRMFIVLRKRLSTKCASQAG